MPSTVTDRLMRGSDYALYLSAQDAKDSINPNPVFSQVRRTEGAVKTEVSYSTSSEVMTDEQAQKQTQESKTFSLEFSAEGYKDSFQLMIAAIFGDESGRTVTTAISTTATGITSSGGELGALNLMPGDYFFLSGFTDDQINNKAYRLLEQIDADSWTTYPAPASEESATDVAVTSNKTASGKSPTYYTAQSRVTDLSKPDGLDYDTPYNGMIGTWSFEVPEEGTCTSSCSMSFEKGTAGVEMIEGQTDAPRTDDNAISAVRHVKNYFVNGVSAACEIKSFSIEVDNSPTLDKASACAGAISSRGSFAVSGSISSRSFASNPFKWRDYQRDGENVEIAFHVTHSDGGESVVVIKSAKITEYSTPNELGAIANADCSYNAQRDDASGTTIEYFRNF